ncbi:MAG: NADH-quinone oxidoreductase subunit C [Methanobacteriota archaeon]|nr:MAG: NADH-quinone oxidoreductase subunit C [Euryarchaeota archaeon]
MTRNHDNTSQKKASMEEFVARFQGTCSVKDHFLLVNVPQTCYLEIAKELKSKGFKRLLTVSVVDWLEEKEFEVYFILYNPEQNTYIKVSTRVSRDKPTIPSLSSLWKNSAMHEREAWELFGITFEGNNMLQPLFLEDWKDVPPFRRDFNWREYHKEVYRIEGA